MSEHVDPESPRCSANPGEDPGPPDRALRLALESLPVAAYVCDARGLITYFNSHAERLWGRAPRLRDPLDRYSGAYRLRDLMGVPIRHDRCWMAMALEQERGFLGGTIVVERPDGGRSTALAHAQPIRDTRDEVTGAVSCLVEITRPPVPRSQWDPSAQAGEDSDSFSRLLEPLVPVRAFLAGLGDRGWGSDAGIDALEQQMRILSRLAEDLPAPAGRTAVAGPKSPSEVRHGHSGAGAPALRAPEGRGLRVLVVDDDRDTTTMFAALLRLTGHVVRTAHDGASALAAGRESRPQVLLLDLGLPGCDGYEVARLVRQECWGRDAVLIAITGWSRDEQRERSSISGFDHHLVKPVDPAVLCRLLLALGGSQSLDS